MQSFDYVRASDETSAIAALARPGAVPIAGGTGLIDLMKLDVEKPSVLVDINALPLATLQPLPDGGMRIGALLRNSELAMHPLVRERYPVLSQALLAGATPQLRNMASVGGNLLQRTRCPYFRDARLPCNKRHPGAGCGALDGYNRMHAVLGGSAHCIATHPSDLGVALAALDAQVHLRGATGERAVALQGFYRLPGETPARETVLAPGELISAVTLPPLPRAARSVYLKLRDRAAFDFALVAVAAVLHLEHGRICEARIALGGVATKPWRAFAAEQHLLGQAPGKAAFAAAAEIAMADARPQRHNGFKIPLAKRAIERALTALEARA